MGMGHGYSLDTWLNGYGTWIQLGYVWLNGHGTSIQEEEEDEEEEEEEEEDEEEEEEGCLPLCSVCVCGLQMLCVLFVLCI